MATAPSRSTRARSAAEAVQQLVGGHVREDDAHQQRGVEVLRHRDRLLLRDTHLFRVTAPDGQRRHPVSLTQRRTALSCLTDGADELVTGSEGWFRSPEVRPGSDQCVGERHTCRLHLDAHLPSPRPGSRLVDHVQNLRTAEAVRDDTLHGLVSPTTSDPGNRIPVEAATTTEVLGLFSMLPFPHDHSQCATWPAGPCLDVHHLAMWQEHDTSGPCQPRTRRRLT